MKWYSHLIYSHVNITKKSAKFKILNFETGEISSRNNCVSSSLSESAVSSAASLTALEVSLCPGLASASLLAPTWPGTVWWNILQSCGDTDNSHWTPDTGQNSRICWKTKAIGNFLLSRDSDFHVIILLVIAIIFKFPVNCTVQYTHALANIMFCPRVHNWSHLHRDCMTARDWLTRHDPGSASDSRVHCQF